jgi:hypothetical protein
MVYMGFGQREDFPTLVIQSREAPAVGIDCGEIDCAGAPKRAVDAARDGRDPTVKIASIGVLAASASFAFMAGHGDPVTPTRTGTEVGRKLKSKLTGTARGVFAAPDR